MLIFLPNDKKKSCTMITDLTMDVFIIMLMESPGLDPRIALSSEGAVIIGRSEIDVVGEEPILRNVVIFTLSITFIYYVQGLKLV